MPRLQVSSSAFVLTGIDHLLVRPRHKEGILSLVDVTGDIVKEQVNSDAGALWMISMAQREYLTLAAKIDACVT